MADLHYLPAPALPEGWASVLGGVAREANLDTLRVYPLVTGRYRGLVNGSSVGLYRSLNEAAAAVERAYCNCGIKEVKRG